MTQPRMFGDRYELGELIGYGGMAEVHRGRDVRLNRDVAIKVLRADLARDPAFLTRFRREAHSAAGLNHPSIVSVYDTGEDVMPDGTAQPFIVMEFVEGRTLRDIVKSEGSLPPRRAMEITADICAALDFSHRNGIIHRDIKPANVMITPQGAVKVMDFGIARAVADNSSTVTQTANVIGTAQYLSPEQARGETVDARSDVYSSGCLLYELVTGVPPFQGDSPVAVAYQHVRENPVMPSVRKPGLPRVLDSIVMKALAKNQLNRYQSAGDMRSDLQRALADQPVTAEAVMTDAERTQFIARTPPPPVAPRREEYVTTVEDESRRNGLVWAAIVLALLLVVGIVAVLILTNSDGNNSKTVPDNLQGLTAGQAQTALSNAGLDYKYGGTTSGKCVNTSISPQTGRACTWSPAPGQSVKEHSVVTVYFYKASGPKNVQLPDVVGNSLSQAKEALIKAGIEPQNIVVHSKNALDMNGNAVANEVLAQNPVAYQVTPQTGQVVLSVATGKLVLPDVKGKTLQEAQQALNQAGFTTPAFKIVNQTTTDQSKDQTVADESPFADGKQAYSPTTQITLTVYQYQAPKPTCTPSPTTNPPSGPAGPSLPGSSSTAATTAPSSGGASSTC